MREKEGETDGVKMRRVGCLLLCFVYREEKSSDDRFLYQKYTGQDSCDN